MSRLNVPVKENMLFQTASHDVLNTFYQGRLSIQVYRPPPRAAVDFSADGREVSTFFQPADASSSMPSWLFSETTRIRTAILFGAI